MSYVWKPSYALDDPLIDGQHRQLLQLANLLAQACAANRGLDVVGDAFRALYYYTSHHFEDEERLLAEIGSPLLDQHRAEHETLTAELKQLWAASRLTLLSDVSSSLSTWMERRMVPHMTFSDPKARWQHIREQNGQSAA